MSFSNGVFTGQLLGETFTITRDLGIRGLCIRLLAGTVTYIGSMKVEGLTPSSRTLDASFPYGISSSTPLHEFTIDATGGECEITLIR